jgi:hypothetical protein
MSIAVTCSSCHASFHVKSQFAGKSGQCPKCGAVIHVPSDLVLDVAEPKTVNSRKADKQTPTAKKSGAPPATERQKDYARSPDIDFPDDIHRREISPPTAKKSGAPPATERQKDYARSLGIDFPEDIDRREISKLIEAAQDQRQDNLAKVEQREGKVYQELRKEIEAEIYRDDKPLSKATPGEMATALENQGFAAIILTFNPEDIGKENANASIAYGDGNLSEEDMRETLMRLGNAVMARRIEELSDRL